MSRTAAVLISETYKLAGGFMLTACCSLQEVTVAPDYSYYSKECCNNCLLLLAVADCCKWHLTVPGDCSEKQLTAVDDCSE